MTEKEGENERRDSRLNVLKFVRTFRLNGLWAKRKRILGSWELEGGGLSKAIESNPLLRAGIPIKRIGWMVARSSLEGLHSVDMFTSSHSKEQIQRSKPERNEQWCPVTFIKTSQLGQR